MSLCVFITKSVSHQVHQPTPKYKLNAQFDRQMGMGEQILERKVGEKATPARRRKPKDQSNVPDPHAADALQLPQNIL